MPPASGSASNLLSIASPTPSQLPLLLRLPSSEGQPCVTKDLCRTCPDFLCHLQFYFRSDPLSRSSKCASRITHLRACVLTCVWPHSACCMLVQMCVGMQCPVVLKGPSPSLLINTGSYSPPSFLVNTGPSPSFLLINTGSPSSSLIIHRAKYFGVGQNPPNRTR